MTSVAMARVNPDFHKQLDCARWKVDGFKLIRSQRIPDLDEPCGRYLTYRDLIECGETQAENGDT